MEPSGNQHRRDSVDCRRDFLSTDRQYHGWRIGADGTVVEVPSEGERSGEFAARVKVNRYAIREGGGLVWAFMGTGEAPKLPPLPFMAVPSEGRSWWRMTVDCNWLQGFEGALDVRIEAKRRKRLAQVDGHLFSLEDNAGLGTRQHL